MRVTVLRGTLDAAAQRAVREAALGPLLRDAGNTLGVPARASLRVRLSDDAELHALNERWMEVDAPTDVLAFPGGTRLDAGDVAISVERAAVQADDAVAELRMLAVHGLLHCLGHDHDTPARAAEMTRLTRALLPGQAVPELQAH